ncbi:uncharacterized protein BXZ73DRAFT_52613 [Epithele typhae]|uniref:uncharacterized protein n=1 Tax=Epithele typhae TaxID=378194 RepID=UPI00200850D0|nr:uncharacterized protein BXZ73DRAFT_52613 [Epithele typhae]KAH9919193.1 hypothetical protein BXZ73DRAFT_52613 [Epithele typhae]
MEDGPRDGLSHGLGLPSDFSSDDVKAYALEDLATAEYKIRLVHAYALLQETRRSVKHTAAYLSDKIRHTDNTQQHNTRAQKLVTQERNMAMLLSARFNHNISRVIHLRSVLGLTVDPQSMEGRLRPMVPDDLHVRNLVAPVNHTADAHASWIWSENCKLMSFGLPPMISLTLSQPVDQTHWQRVRNEKVRADVWVNTTCADLRHYRDGCACMSRCWEAAAMAPNTSLGSRAYAYQQADMYKKLQDTCQKAYQDALPMGWNTEELDHSSVSGSANLAVATVMLIRWSTTVPPRSAQRSHAQYQH